MLIVGEGKKSRNYGRSKIQIKARLGSLGAEH